MKKNYLSAKGYIFIIFFVLLLFRHFFIGIKLIPTECDSVTYHIPIAQSILTGEFIKPNYDIFFRYFPGSAESILSLFILSSIPLGLYNWLAVLCLFIASYFLFLKINSNKNIAIVYAFSVATLNSILRWISVQTVDIWLLVFFTQALSMLLKPEDKDKFYIILGFYSGMIVGTKFSGLLFLPVLLFIYRKNFLEYINLKRFILFSIPVLIFGLFWYVRNYFSTGNPFYPMHSFLFKGVPTYPGHFVWQSIIQKPYSVFNALISEYMIWGFLIFLPIIFLFKKFKKMTADKNISKLMLLGLMNSIIFLFLPSAIHYQSLVSAFRYAFPAFTPQILALFLILLDYKAEKVLILTSLASLLMIVSPEYHPKVLFIILPILLFIFARKELLNLKKLF